MIVSRKERDLGADSVSREYTEDPLPQAVFPPVIYHDSRQEFKCPPSEIRSQQQAAHHLSCLPITRPRLEKKTFIFHYSVFCWKMGGSGMRKGGERWRSQTWGGMEPDSGARMQGW